MPVPKIIVVGASAGGVEALTTLARGLPANLPAAVFVVLHVPADSPSLLPKLINRVGPLEALHPYDGMAIETGKIYIAPPDHHMIIEQDRVRVVRGPRENRHRPAIDPLFRSAAWEYGPNALGVVLTGALDDGTAGLLAIKQRGGVAVVQDPNEALYPSMPRSALAHVDVDYCVPMVEIPPLLASVAETAVERQVEHAGNMMMEREINIAKADGDERQHHHPLGTPSVFSCPECGGVLHEVQDGQFLRFRCRVGHGFTPETVLAEQADALEQALWSALNTLEESASLSRRMRDNAQSRGQHWLATRFQSKVDEAEQRAATIHNVLIKNEIIATDGLTAQEQAAADQSSLQG